MGQEIAEANKSAKILVASATGVALLAAMVSFEA